MVRLVGLAVGLLASLAVADDSVYSGFKPDCQSCLDQSTNACPQTQPDLGNCVCLGAGFQSAFGACLHTCGADTDSAISGVMFTQWADYCCAIAPDTPDCVQYISTRTSHPTSTAAVGGGGGSAASTTGAGPASTTRPGNATSNSPGTAGPSATVKADAAVASAALLGGAALVAMAMGLVPHIL